MKHPIQHARQPQAQGGQPGRQPVGQVVQPGRGVAEVAVALVPVAHHGVQRIDGLVGQRQRRAPQQRKQQRRGNAIDGVFRHGFHRAPGNLGFIQSLGITPHHSGQRLPRAGQIALPQRGGNGPPGIRQPLDGQRGGQQPQLGGQPQPGVHPRQQRKPQPGHRQGAQHHHQGKAPAQQAPPLGAAMVPAVLQGANRLAEDHHRVGQRARVPHDQIDDDGQRAPSGQSGQAQQVEAHGALPLTLAWENVAMSLSMAAAACSSG